MSISRLRNLDIMSKEDELLVQEVLNTKLMHVPDPEQIHATASETDAIKSKEDELALQAKLDAQRAAKKAKVASAAAVPAEEVADDAPIEEVKKKASRPKKAE